MNHLTLQLDQARQKISRHIYGHFAEHLGRCVYEGIWVGEDSGIPNTRGMRNDVIAALKKLKMPNLRWPGGCFADTYHWMDGIGPREKRPGIVNSHWGWTVENNHFGTHEFLDFCELIGTEPYICGNVGSGTVQEMSQWLEYLTFAGGSPMADLRRNNGREKPWAIPFWAVGNENWGCGGNMTAQQYAWEYRKFQTYCHSYSGPKLYKVACGHDDNWNEILLKDAHRFIDGLSVHYYTIVNEWKKKGAATGFPLEEWHRCLDKALGIEKFIRSTSAIMDRVDPDKRIGIVMDEWGTWFDVEPGTNAGFLYQQNTIRDALVAGLTLNIFNQHADRMHLANIAQTINVLQAMILTEGEKMILTPTYHVFDMFKVHQDATLVPAHLMAETYEMDGKKIPQINASASIDGKGRMHLSLCNLHHETPATVKVELRGGKVKEVAGKMLTAAALDAHNTFEKPNTVKPRKFEGAQLSRGGLTVELPARAVVMLEMA